eukprot:345563-Prorocentrum_minimum.AAC.4
MSYRRVLRRDIGGPRKRMRPNLQAPNSKRPRKPEVAHTEIRTSTEYEWRYVAVQPTDDRLPTTDSLLRATTHQTLPPPEGTGRIRCR